MVQKNGVTVQVIDDFTVNATLAIDAQKRVFQPYFAHATAEGGVPPYQLRYKIYKNGTELFTTEWFDTLGGYAYEFIPVELANFSFRVDAMDQRGVIVSGYSGSVDTAEPPEIDQEAIERSRFYHELQNIFNMAKSPDKMEGYAYYQSYPDEYDWWMQWVSICSGKFGEANTYTRDRDYHIYNAMKMAATEGSFKFYKVDSLPQECDTLAKLAKLTETEIGNAFVKWVDKDVTKKTADDFAQAFEMYRNDELSESELSTLLRSWGCENQTLTDMLAEFDIMKTLGGFSKALKTIGNVTKYTNSVLDVVNQVALVDAIDMNQLLVIADSYSRGTEAQKAAGKTLKEFAHASRDERVKMIISGKGTALCLDEILGMINQTGSLTGTVGGGMSAVYKLTVSAIDTLSEIIGGHWLRVDLRIKSGQLSPLSFGDP